MHMRLSKTQSAPMRRTFSPAHSTGDDQDGWCDDCLAAWDDHTAEEYDRFVNEWEHFCNA